MKYQEQIFLENLRKYERTPFFLNVAMSIFVVFFMIALTAFLSFPYSLASQFILGAMYAHMVELQHEALHGAMKKKWANRIVGFLLGFPMLISYSDYQYHHMIHHEYIGTHKDTEYFNYSDKKAFSVLQFIISLFMLSHYKSVFIKIAKIVFLNEFEKCPKNIKKRIRLEYILFLVFIASIIGLSILYKTLLVLKVWLIPLFVFAAPIHFLIELPEHVFCNKNDISIFKNTRTIKSNRFMSWFVNGNNYHVEHHYSPNHPIGDLQDLHPELKNKIEHFNDSYFGFYKMFFRKILK